MAETVDWLRLFRALRIVVSTVLVCGLLFFVPPSKYGGACCLFWAWAFNTVAMFSNGGKMPAIYLEKETIFHKPLDEKTKLGPLCDIFSIGRASFSIGDILAFIALLLFIVL